MKALITATAQFGPFLGVERTQQDDGWVADGCVYPDAATGGAKVGDYTPPEPAVPEKESIVRAQILALEEQQTERLVREAVLGGDYAIEKLAQIEAEISALREQL